MKTTIVSFDELSRSDRADWLTACDRGDLWGHPCFRPEFTEVLTRVRPNTRVALLAHNGRRVGVLPLELSADRTARAVGFGISDFQGVIPLEPADRPASDGSDSSLPAACDARWLLDECGLRRFRYDHWWTAGWPPTQPYEERFASRFLDLQSGFAAFYQRRLQQGSTRLRKTGQLARKLARQFGPLRFTLDDPDPQAARLLRLWKRAQYERTGALDVLAIPWVDQALQHFAEIKTPQFAGCLMTLRAGERIVAVHFGLRSRQIVHWWFPTYDPQLANYSPGLVMLVEAARELAADGCRRIDLGKGEEPFKASLTHDADEVAAGCWGASRWGCQMRQRGKQLYGLARRIPGSVYLRNFSAALHRRRKRNEFQ